MRALFVLILLFPLQSRAAQVGDPAPVFKLPRLDTETVFSSESLAGRVTYLDFWASWCGPCRVSFPEIIKLKADLGDKPFEVVAISVDEDPEDAMRFLKRYETSYPILIDSAGKTAGAYELPGMPTSFIIDGSGVIRERHEGFKPGDMKAIREKIEQLLIEAPR